MKSFTFRQYRRTGKEGSSKEDAVEKDSAAYLKRREQVRRAQRTHRERKEAYIKSLENEVLQLRSNEANMMQETKNLYAEIGRLKRLLEQHGIVHEAPHHNFSLPSHPDAYGSPHNAPSVISIRQNPGHQGQQQVHVHSTHHQQSPSTPTPEFYLSESDGSIPAVSGANSGGSSLRRKFSFFRGRGHSGSGSVSHEDVDSSSHHQISAPSPQQLVSTPPTTALTIHDLNETDLGLEFVLTLESPCLNHTQPDPANPHNPTGHALTATAPLLYQAPDQYVDIQSNTITASKSDAIASTWQTPNTGLERLLSLSTNFELTDELTPVQAWHQLRSHPNFSGIEIQKLRRFTGDLRKSVKCYGFGAVVETDVFFDLVEGLLFPRGLVWGGNGWGVPGVF